MFPGIERTGFLPIEFSGGGDKSESEVHFYRWNGGGADRRYTRRRPTGCVPMTIAWIREDPRPTGTVAAEPSDAERRETNLWRAYRWNRRYQHHVKRALKLQVRDMRLGVSKGPSADDGYTCRDTQRTIQIAMEAAWRDPSVNTAFENFEGVEGGSYIEIIGRVVVCVDGIGLDGVHEQARAVYCQAAVLKAKGTVGIDGKEK